MRLPLFSCFRSKAGFHAGGHEQRRLLRHRHVAVVLGGDRVRRCASGIRLVLLADSALWTMAGQRLRQIKLSRVCPLFFLCWGLLEWRLFSLWQYQTGYTLLMDIAILRMLAVILLIPAIYLLYSVIRYFGFTRALGADHFDEKYRMLPLVRRGIFRFTDNGMYTYGFLFYGQSPCGMPRRQPCAPRCSTISISGFTILQPSCRT